MGDAYCRLCAVIFDRTLLGRGWSRLLGEPCRAMVAVMSWLLYPPYTLAFLVIVVLGAIGVLAVRKREAVMAYGSGCGLLLIATLVYLLTAVLSGFACANNPCGGTVSVLLTYAAPPFIASIFTGLAAVGLLIFGAVTDWQGRDNVLAGATATTTRSTAVA